MRVIRYPYIKSFFSENLDFLEKEEAVNNLLIGIPRSFLSETSSGAVGPVKKDSKPGLTASSVNINLYSLKNDEGDIIFSLVQTPPLNYLIYGREDSAPAFSKSIIPELYAAKIKANGVIGPETLALNFAKQWQSITGQSWSVHFRQWLYQLDELRPVPLSPGALRLAQEKDVDIIVDWMNAFEREAMGNERPAVSGAAILSRIRQETLYLWQDKNPVAMTSVARPTRHGISINYVFTPEANRGKGYASTCVYEVSKLMLQQYDFCSLFTDRSNPTSNKIYTRMGYYPVKKFVEIRFI